MTKTDTGIPSFNFCRTKEAEEVIMKHLKVKTMSRFTLANDCETAYATLHMAGDINHARALTRKFVMRGACVQLAPCDYVYTGGVESGFTARVICYPRFPKTLEDLTHEAVALGDFLAEELGQVSFSVETSEKTYYFTHPTYVKK